MKIVRVFIPIYLIFFLLSCTSKPTGWWQEGKIGVMADSTDWEALQGPLRNSIEHVIRTPQPEKSFALVHVSDQDFERYSEFRYLIIAATLNSEGKIGQIVQDLLVQSNVRSGIETGEYFLFTQKNQWARNQILVILVGRDIQTLRRQIESNGQMLYAIFDRDFKRRTEKEMFGRKEEKKLEKHLFDLYGWTLRIQHDYHLMDEVSEDGYVWLRRLYPERWIFIHWIEKGDTLMLNTGWVVQERNRLEKSYMEGEEVSEHYLVSFRSKFLGRDAIVTTGLWEQKEKVVGGPFKNYTFYDSLSGRLYMIDLAVFAPEYSDQKLPFLKRMDIMAHTFRTVYDPVGDK
jgi:hypothetical protein